MRFVDRMSVEVPEYFAGERAQSARQAIADFLALPEDERLQRRPEIDDAVLRDTSVVEGLRTLFRGKCAFCERPVSASPADRRATRGEAYRFRPTMNARARERAVPSFLHYVWLAEDWRNLYLACAECRRDRNGMFPVKGKPAPVPTAPAMEFGGGDAIPPRAEQNLLLDPCVNRDVANHLRFRGDGTAEGLTVRGDATIGYFDLNRAPLLPMRARQFAENRKQLLLRVGDGTLSRADDALFGEVPAFAGGWRLHLQDLAKRIQIATLRRPKSVGSLRAFFANLATGSDGAALLERAIESERTERAKPTVATPAVVTGEPERPPAEAEAIRRIAIRNFKSLEQLDITMPELPPSSPAEPHRFHAPALLILGENAAGKSTILEAIALALGSRLDVDALKLHVEHAHRRFILDPEMMGGHRAGPKRTASVEITFADGSRRSLSITAGGLRHSAGEVPAVFAYGAFRQYLSRVKHHRRRAGARLATLFETDRILPDPEPWLLGLSDDEFPMVVRALRPILAVEGEFDVVVRNRKTGRCEIVHRLEPDNPADDIHTPLSEVSSGFRAMLAMACDVLRGLMDRSTNPGFTSLEDARAIVLIDEVEAHLHPRWKIQVMRGLREALPLVTFIASTHDPLCLRGMLDGEVMVLTRTARRALPAHATEMPVKVETLVQLPKVSKLTIEQLLTSDLFSLFSTDPPETEIRFAEIADLLAKRERGERLDKPEQEALTAFAKQIGDALPIGNSETLRIVQEAVAMYLRKRRAASARDLAGLKKEARRRILAALEAF